MTVKQLQSKSAYRRFKEINGTHPWREAAPNGYVDYRARSRHGGRVYYFNFDLAKEMGLLPQRHAHELTPGLCAAVLDTFALVIINEYDIIHNVSVRPQDIKPNAYMATRYLQLQHPNKKGLTSGDGRSIWNGAFKGRDAWWDISSCGTGATCLSPATAIERRFFKTGEKNASYGCGRADLLDGIAAAVMSDVFYRSGIPTERTLAVIGFPDGSAINVRAARNLLRPAHLFRYLKLGNYDGLKSAVDYYIQRQMDNGTWPRMRTEVARYRYFLQRVARDFARAVALFETEYIFCWLDWDGDNILGDGSILDYGSVRQFGLFHHEYRYDDVERFSTTITEQKAKAKYIVQVYAQIVDYLITGKRRSIRSFAKHSSLQLFEAEFQFAKETMLPFKLGYDMRTREALVADRRARQFLRQLRRDCDYFERAKSVAGPYEVPDGITWDAVFCLRDLLRELPARYMHKREPLAPQECLMILRSDYATDDDCILSAPRRKKLQSLQTAYLGLLERAAELRRQPVTTVLKRVAQRSAVVNRYERVTGDAVLRVAETIIQHGRELANSQVQKLIETFVDEQILVPEYQRRRSSKDRSRSDLISTMLAIVRDCRAGL